MTTIEILLITWAAGLVLERRGDQIVVHGLKPDAPPELLRMLREHKPQLLAALTDREGSDVEAPPHADAGRQHQQAQAAVAGPNPMARHTCDWRDSPCHGIPGSP